MEKYLTEEERIQRAHNVANRRRACNINATKLNHSQNREHINRYNRQTCDTNRAHNDMAEDETYVGNRAYYTNHANEGSESYDGENSQEKRNSRIKKLSIQIIACVCIYCGFYYAKSSSNGSTSITLNNVKSKIEQDVDFKEFYKNMKNKFENFSSYIDKNTNNLDKSYYNAIEKDESYYEVINNTSDYNAIDCGESCVSNNNAIDCSELSVSNYNTIDCDSATVSAISNSFKTFSFLCKKNSKLGIGGEDDSSDEIEMTEYSVEQEEEQMKNDASYIKEKISVINPLPGGIITSSFGIRESSQIVSANHKGLDIGAETGTNIISATDGKVIETSSEGDLGIHLKIERSGIIFIYAHCSEILINDGDEIHQGQIIAKVGATGKATGPHLHFEIRKDGRAVDPEMVIK